MVRALPLMAAAYAVALASSSVTVTKVFESASIAEFNRWVTSHAADFPDLVPVRITVDALPPPTRGTPHFSRVRFWGPDGEVTREMEFRGDADVFPDGDKVVTRERDEGEPFALRDDGPHEHVWYDASGREILRGDFCIYRTPGPLLFEVAGWCSDATLVIRDGAGNVLGSFRDRGAQCLEVGTVWSRDTTCVLRLDGAVVVVSRQGNALWRKTFGEAYNSQISADGTRVAVMHDGVINVYDRAGRTVARHRAGFGLGPISLSANGDRVVASRDGRVEMFSNVARRRLWQIELPSSEFRRTARAIRVLDDMVVLVLSDQHVHFLDPSDGTALCEALDLELGAGGERFCDEQHRIVTRVAPSKEWDVSVHRNVLLVEAAGCRKAFSFRRPR